MFCQIRRCWFQIWYFLKLLAQRYPSKVLFVLASVCYHAYILTIPVFHLSHIINISKKSVMTLIVCFLNLLSEVRILSNLVTIGSFSLCVPTLPNWIAINIVVVETKFFSFFLLSGFSFTDTDDSQDSRGREGTFFYSTLPLPPAHKHSDIFCIF